MFDQIAGRGIDQEHYCYKKKDLYENLKKSKEAEPLVFVFVIFS